MEIDSRSPFVTVAIPFYNCENYLSKAIISVINQSYQNWELLLIDDGSTDSSKEIVESFAVDDPRIRIVSDGINRGLVYRLNQSIQLARGVYYARMDADDIMHTDRLKEQLDFFSVHSAIDILGTSAYTIDQNDKLQDLIIYDGIPHTDPFHPCFLHPSVMGKTDWFRKYLYDSDYERMEDLELWLRAAKESSYYNLKKPLMFYRESGIPIFRKYIATQRSALKLAFNAGKYGLNCYDKIKLVVFIFIKCFVCWGLNLIGKSHWQIKLRKRPTLAFDKNDGYKMLRQAICSPKFYRNSLFNH